MNSTTKERITHLDETLAELDARIARAAAKLEPLEQKVQRLARGTLAGGEAKALPEPEETKPGRRQRAKRDTIPTPAAPSAPLAERLESALRTRPMGIVELARHLRVPVGGVTAALRSLRKSHQLWNLGSEEMPRWVWVVGKKATQDELRTAVTAIIKERPVLFAELLAATGNERGRVSSILVNLQRQGHKVENHGTEARARWYIPGGVKR